MEDVLKKLTEYTLTLRDALKSTNNANERALLTGHLAAAAEMFALLHSTDDINSIRDLVKSEIRSHGLSFITGTVGESIAHKWVDFTKAIGIQQ